MDGSSDTQQTASRVHLAIILMKFQVHLSKAFAKLDLRNGSEVTIDFFLLEERKSCIFGGGNGGGGLHFELFFILETEIVNRTSHLSLKRKRVWNGS